MAEVAGIPDTDSGTYQKYVAMRKSVRIFLEDVWIFPHLMEDDSMKIAMERIADAIDDEVRRNQMAASDYWDCHTCLARFDSDWALRCHHRKGCTVADQPQTDTEHDHRWGLAERSRISATSHRKCMFIGCKAITLDLVDE